MINFSRVDTLDNLKKAIDELPGSTSSANPQDVLDAKTVVLNRLKSLEGKTNGAHVNIRVNTIGTWGQTEIQVSGQTIKVTPPAA